MDVRELAIGSGHWALYLKIGGIQIKYCPLQDFEYLCDKKVDPFDYLTPFYCTACRTSLHLSTVGLILRHKQRLRDKARFDNSVWEICSERGCSSCLMATFG